MQISSGLNSLPTLTQPEVLKEDAIRTKETSADELLQQRSDTVSLNSSLPAATPATYTAFRPAVPNSETSSPDTASSAVSTNPMLATSDASAVLDRLTANILENPSSALSIQASSFSQSALALLAD